MRGIHRDFAQEPAYMAFARILNLQSALRRRANGWIHWIGVGTTEQMFYQLDWHCIN